MITGETPVRERERLFESFRQGETRVLVVSKVANFSVDLPEAGVAIQVSGTFGSRQEEAQRLGRVLRPKADGRAAHFYSIVTRDTVDADFAQHRQRFLAEQGYAYRIIDAEDIHSGSWDVEPRSSPRPSCCATSSTHAGDTASSVSPSRSRRGARRRGGWHPR